MPYVYLALHVLFGSGFSLGLKATILRRKDTFVVGGLNYILACAVGTPWLFLAGGTDYGWPAANFGATMGIMYFVAYFFFIFAIRHQGLAAATAVGQLSVLIPILFSVFVWSELPTAAQFAGLVIAGAAVALLDARKDALSGISGRLRWCLIGFFVSGGIARLAAKAFTEAHVPAERPFYMWMVYASAGACSLVMLVGHRKWPDLEEWLLGAAVGVCNITQVTFMLMSLEHLPGIIVFPISACGTIVVAGTIVVVFLGERPTFRLYLGIASSAIAVALLNIRPPSHGS